MALSSGHNRFANAAALRISAACVLSGCLAFGLLPFAAWGASPDGEKASQADSSPSASTEQTDSNNKDFAATSADPLRPSEPPTDAVAPGISTAPESPAPSPALPEKPSGSTVSSDDSATAPDPSAAELVWAVGLDDNAMVTVALHPDGTLEVQGVGKTVAFKEVEKVDGAKSITTPWLAEGHANRIKRVEFESAVELESLAYWFDGCKNLKEVGGLPASAKDLTAAFRNCTSLVEAPALPEKAETIASVFEGCEKLEKAAVIPSSVETVSAAFKGCVALQQAPSIPASVKDMSAAFSGCSVLTAVPQIEGTPKKMDQAFFDCPAITIVPEAFSFAASRKACFGFSGTSPELLKTVYNGPDKIVLAYDWTADGRVLVDADGVKRSEAAEGDPGNAGDANGAAGKGDDGVGGEDALGQKSPEGAIDDASSSPNEEPVVQNPYDPSQAQVNITVPSSIPLLLGSNGPNSASIPVSIENRSDAAVKIVGARLKRSDVDYPSGSWSLVSPASGRHFIDEARFTPAGLEAVLDTPVGLPADSGVINLVWEGSFTDYGIKTLLSAAASSDGSFTYGTLIWHVEVVR